MRRWFGHLIARLKPVKICKATDGQIKCDRPAGHPGLHDGPIPSWVAPDARWAWGDPKKRYVYDEEEGDA